MNDVQKFILTRAMQKVANNYTEQEQVQKYVNNVRPNPDFNKVEQVYIPQPDGRKLPALPIEDVNKDLKSNLHESNHIPNSLPVNPATHESNHIPNRSTINSALQRLNNIQQSRGVMGNPSDAARGAASQIGNQPTYRPAPADMTAYDNRPSGLLGGALRALRNNN